MVRAYRILDDKLNLLSITLLWASCWLCSARKATSATSVRFRLDFLPAHFALQNDFTSVSRSSDMLIQHANALMWSCVAVWPMFLDEGKDELGRQISFHASGSRFEKLKFSDMPSDILALDVLGALDLEWDSYLHTNAWQIERNKLGTSLSALSRPYVGKESPSSSDSAICQAWTSLEINKQM